MTFEDAAFGRDVAATMRHAYEEACAALPDRDVEVTEVVLSLMRLQIMTAVQWGERDPQRLKELAVAAVVPQSNSG